METEYPFSASSSNMTPKPGLERLVVGVRSLVDDVAGVVEASHRPRSLYGEHQFTWVTRASLSDSQLRAIGRVTVNFSIMEQAMRLCVPMFLGPGQQGFIATSLLDFRTLRSVLDALCKRKFAADPGNIAKLTRIMNGVEEAARKRNKVVHSFWLPTDSGGARGIRFPAGPRNWPKSPVFDMSAAELDEIADYIDTITADIGNLIPEIYGEPRVFAVGAVPSQEQTRDENQNP